MAFTLEEIEHYHDIGLMPDWAYYQQNGKSAQENYNEQTRIIKERYLERMQEQALEKEIEKKVEEALEDFLDGFDFGNISIIL